MNHKAQEILLASIVIPIHNFWQRSWMVQDCLVAISQQTVSGASFEVLLVNNSPLEEKQWEVIFESFKDKLNLKILHEPQLGSYAARNRGVRLAQGKILAFIDSDCIPSSDWLEKGIAVLSDAEKNTIIGGRIKKIGRATKPNCIERHEKLFTLNQRKNIHSGGFIATANLMVFRDFFREVGPFNQNLVASGDVEWSFRAQEKGAKLLYSNKVFVFHRVVSSFPDVIKRYRRKAGGHQALKKLNACALKGKNYSGYQARRLLSFKGFLTKPEIRLNYFLRFVQNCELLFWSLGNSGLPG
jgi:GT2 family glycosyltransferase